MQEKVEIITNHFEHFWNYWTKILKNGYCEMIKFQTLKLPQFHKAKTCWTENWWSSGIMSNF